MRALTVAPGRAGSLAVTDVPDPEPVAGELLVDGLAVGVCGTDREIAGGAYGAPPPARERLVIGHESLGRVRTAPPDSGFAPGDLIAGVVRRPDPEPCGACAHGEPDMCRNGGYTERGISGLDGYASPMWTVPPEYAVRLNPGLERTGVLLEPAAVVVKAWEQVQPVGERSWFAPRRALITGAGPIGLLAALLAVQRGLDTHVLDIVSRGPKPDLVRALGATYHHDGLDAAVASSAPDVVIEATGVSSVVFGALAATAPYGIVCLTGMSSGARRVELDGGGLNRELVLENDAVVGSVNANRRHFTAAAAALALADPGWLQRLISRRVPLERADEAFDPEDDDVKVVVEVGR
ncbi:MAG: theronine dehydrogenase [Pseudonocardiaceae bacterium]|nr:MAG: theronine dehydrogenase [Pseudonocardiaceae bacterium]